MALHQYDLPLDLKDYQTKDMRQLLRLKRSATVMYQEAIADAIKSKQKIEMISKVIKEKQDALAR